MTDAGTAGASLMLRTARASTWLIRSLRGSWVVTGCEVVTGWEAFSGIDAGVRVTSAGRDDGAGGSVAGTSNDTAVSPAMRAHTETNGSTDSTKKSLTGDPRRPLCTGVDSGR